MRFEPPKVGTIIWKKKFAFFPKKIGRTIIWFESYYCKRDLRQHSVPAPFFVSSTGNITTSYKEIPYGDPYWVKNIYLNNSPEVQEYLISISSLAKALKED